MRRRIVTFAVALLTMLAMAMGASAHSAHPCNDSDEPGNSAYARHHIRALALEQGLGNEGHKPGTHRGYSLCLGVHGD